jgi:hypothetical protein
MIIYYKINYKDNNNTINKLICKTNPDDGIGTIKDLCDFWKYMLQFNFDGLKYPQFAIMEITEEEYNGYKNGYLYLGDYVMFEDYDE